MPRLSISEFADRVDEIMHSTTREFLRFQAPDFMKTRITMPQFFMLNILRHNADAKMIDLADIMGVTTAAITGAIDRLVREGYVTRKHDDLDRRVVRVNLTVKGKDVVERVCGERKKLIVRLFSGITEKEREKYLEIMQHIKENMRREG